MAIKREQLYKMIGHLPDNKLNELYDVIKRMSEPSEVSFEEAFEYAIKHYDDALRGLKDR